jgi:ribosome-associated protein
MILWYAYPMLIVTPEIAIEESELQESFLRASGPGGQNVNKVSTAVQLRFDLKNSPSLPEPVRERLVRQAAGHITADGILVIEARRFRTQERNRQDARERLVALVRRALVTPKPRRPTRPSRAAQEQRLEDKRRRGIKKRLRNAKPGDEE